MILFRALHQKPLMLALAFAAPALVFAQKPALVQIHGTVLDDRTGKPVLAAVVEWLDDANELQAVTQSNNRGQYALFVRSGEALYLRVKEQGYRDRLDTLPALPAEPSLIRRELRLIPK